jgi:hypothetical protein
MAGHDRDRSSSTTQRVVDRVSAQGRRDLGQLLDALGAVDAGHRLISALAAQRAGGLLALQCGGPGRTVTRSRGGGRLAGVLLENVLRFEDGQAYTVDDAKAVAGWLAKAGSDKEVPFKPARILMQDFTGVPAVVDLAAMRDEPAVVLP